MARVMTRIFADALGLTPDFFGRYIDHSPGATRMNSYALPPGTEVTLDGDLIGTGEHSDYGIVTILWADQVKGPAGDRRRRVVERRAARRRRPVIRAAKSRGVGSRWNCVAYKRLGADPSR